MAIQEKIISIILPKVINLVAKQLTSTGSTQEIVDEADIERHLIEVKNWCTRVQFFGLSKAQETEKESIALTLHSTPRRFRGALKKCDLSSEQELLRDSSNHLLLGDPGSGKTTTLKRLAYHLLTSGPTKNEIPYQFPIVLLCKELDLERTLIENIAERIGIKIKPVEISDLKKKYQPTVGNQPLSHFLADTLNKMRPLIVIDGIDEVSTEKIDSLFVEMTRFVRLLDEPKVIATCRSGVYRKTVEGFNVVEIMPLDHTQIDKIARLWLTNPKPFYVALNDRPYADVTDRPLLLTQLLFIFKRQGYLPEQPSSVYRKVIQLLLEDWDADRGIKRRSKYAHFEAERKLDFLAELSFILTVKKRSKVFTRADLISAYNTLRFSFGLPSEEADEVAAEIESHNGIIVSSGFEGYEFAHLSIQEFLCAYYVVRAPFTPDFEKYLAFYPAPMAIAVALSSDPSHWLTSLLLQTGSGPVFANLWSVKSFLKRMILECPCFKPDVQLGLSFIRLLFAEDLAEEGFLEAVCKLPGVQESIAAGLQKYQISKYDSTEDSYYFEELDLDAAEAFPGQLPEAFWIKRKPLLDLLKSTKMILIAKEGDETFKFVLNPKGQPPF